MVKLKIHVSVQKEFERYLLFKTNIIILLFKLVVIVLKKMGWLVQKKLKNIKKRLKYYMNVKKKELKINLKGSMKI